ncbi:MAG: AAA family ATPase [Cruoricaptor ignavus]|nr:AAA family ATPase [Cruoricaptor ignavus]
MKITELAQQLGISIYALKQFITDFDLELSDCLFPNLEIKPEFEKFAIENQEFLKDYEADLMEEKSCQQIAKEINKPLSEVENIIKKQKPNLFENGMYKSSVSSYGIDHELGGNYSFVYNYFGEKMPLTQRDFIGYRDLYFYITEMLNPFIDERQTKDWGIRKPAGIVLYGPKGSGKIFWAKKIAEIIDYKFLEVKKSYLKRNFINGKKTDFNDFLATVMFENKKLLFLENADEIAMERNSNVSQIVDNEDAKEAILSSIHKFVEENLLMIIAADNLTGMDTEILAPGRFDVKIPVFPPNKDERAEMIMRYIMLDLETDAVLMKILKHNKADQKPYWMNIADQMKLFSNTMVIDFTQSLKKRLRTQYLKLKTPFFQIETILLRNSLIESASKLTEDYLNSVQQFIFEVSANDYDVFAQRIENLKYELDNYKIVEQPRRQIGFGKIESNENEG